LENYLLVLRGLAPDVLCEEFENLDLPVDFLGSESLAEGLTQILVILDEDALALWDRVEEGKIPMLDGEHQGSFTFEISGVKDLFQKWLLSDERFQDGWWDSRVEDQLMQKSFVVSILQLLAVLLGQIRYAGEKLFVFLQVWVDLEIYQRIAPELEIHVYELF
jgi:hypothetical protein